MNILVFGGTFNALSDDWSKGGGGYNFTEGVDTKDLQNVTVTGKKPKSKDNSDLDVSMDSSKFVAKSPEQIHNDLCNGPWKGKDVCGHSSSSINLLYPDNVNLGKKSGGELDSFYEREDIKSPWEPFGTRPNPYWNGK